MCLVKYIYISAISLSLGVLGEKKKKHKKKTVCDINKLPVEYFFSEFFGSLIIVSIFMPF